MIKCRVNDHVIDALMDSGSVRTFMSGKIAKQLDLFILPAQRTVRLADQKLHAKIIGEVVVDLQLEDNRHTGVVVEVIRDLFTDLIIGKDIQKKYSKVTYEFGGPKDELVIGAVANTTFPTMNVPPPPLFAHLSKDTTPIAVKSRRYSRADEKFIKDETSKMLAEGVIEPSISLWRAQVLVTSSENHKKRLVVDYSDTINRFTQLDAYPMPNMAKMVDDIAQYNVFSTLDLKSAYHQLPI